MATRRERITSFSVCITSPRPNRLRSRYEQTGLRFLRHGQFCRARRAPAPLNATSGGINRARSRDGSVDFREEGLRSPPLGRDARDLASQPGLLEPGDSPAAWIPRCFDAAHAVERRARERVGVVVRRLAARQQAHHLHVAALVRRFEPPPAQAADHSPNSETQSVGLPKPGNVSSFAM
jgi:hypothetical protein